MRRTALLSLSLSLSCLSLLGGCAANQQASEPARPAAQPVTFDAPYTSTPVKVDGKLDDAIWTEAPAYELSLATGPGLNNGVPEDKGRVRFAWDDRYFYMAVDFADRDVVAEGTENGLHHYRLGDVAELFLKPESEPGYWEMYVTPRGNQTVFYFPGRGRVSLEEHFQSRSILNVAATVDGSLNHWQDVDHGWTGEMAVPISELREKSGVDFAPGGAVWRVFVGRYNYSRYRKLATGPELSMAPQLPTENFHDLDNYARLNLVRR